MLTLTSGILRSDWTESFMMPMHRHSKISSSFALFTEKQVWYLAGHCYYLYAFGWMGWVWMGGGEAIHTCDQSAHDPPMCVCVCACVCACMQACMRVCARARVCRWLDECEGVVFRFQCVSVSLCFVWLSMCSNVLLCYWLLCEYAFHALNFFKWQSALSRGTHTINSMCGCMHRNLWTINMRVCQVTYPS